jgi:hypothetical protein
MRGTIVLDRRVEYSILHDVRPIGPSIGFYAGRDIRESVVDVFGRRFLYAGVAPRKWDGVFDVEALKAGEFIVQPGLVYRLATSGVAAPWWKSLIGAARIGDNLN